MEYGKPPLRQEKLFTSDIERLIERILEIQYKTTSTTYGTNNSKRRTDQTAPQFKRGTISTPKTAARTIRNRE